jgi:hypothetical protein
MHDYIHAAIATERIRELVESADAQRATHSSRRPRRARPDVPAPRPAPAPATGGRLAALLRLRPWLG